MLNQAGLKTGLERLRAQLETNILERSEDEPSIAEDLKRHYEAAKTAKRTGLAFELWRENEITQAAVAWLLGCVFVRFLEDNELIEQPWISGPGERLDRAKEHNLQTYRAGKHQTDRDYLLLCFNEIAKLPGVSALFDEEHNPLYRLSPTGHGARAIIDFFQRTGDGGNLNFEFTGTLDNTRFLGDLYQNISESARKRYALVQTPEFVVDFILDRTMTPALEEFGLDGFRIIDPACGSGHFLLAAFERLFYGWQRHAPDLDPVEHANRALGSLYGVDVNPFAIAIARFRLLIAALRVCEVKRLRDNFDFNTNLAVGDSLLHGTRPQGAGGEVQRHAFEDALNFYYETEDKDNLREYLKHDNYHAVVGNPPYISVKDPALRETYRQRFGSCYRTYQLGIPFAERFFDLAIRGDRAGYVGFITAIAFAKQHFGRKLIEEFVPKWELTHVVDTSRAHIPAHGTPTVVILARNRLPVTSTVRVVGGIRAEAVTPDDPAKGAVWVAIVRQIDLVGSESEFVSVRDVERAILHKHPWSIGGGGTAGLKERIDNVGPALEVLLRYRIGGAVRIGDEEPFIFSTSRVRRSRIPPEQFRNYLVGENVRDWMETTEESVWYPYAGGDLRYGLRYLWQWRTSLANRATFQGVMADAGREWYEYMQFTASAYETPLSIAFSNLATHNHFSMDRGGKIFNSHAPVIKLNTDSQDDHVALIALMNSSLACFWLRQVCHNKGGGGIGGGLATEAWEQFYELTGGALSKLSLPSARPVAANAIQQYADQRTALLPTNFIARE